MPRLSTTIWALDDAKGQLELRQRGPSAMLLLSSYLKDAFKKFEQDFLATLLWSHLVKDGEEFLLKKSTPKNT